ncbi:hypothetical protein HYE67_011275 [Fusarium culmorum]|uniref:Uncharacterized protein n=1 Tax=Fusarium culmorum TaxID=5516 RepID=A0A2T4GIM7_FUSCU|nr:hypothetical protein FCULG_00009190 [Fusarium culmorum]QPC69044.1 hypothetical protein HYE67_011275 [Fusarium culmorum]
MYPVSINRADAAPSRPGRRRWITIMAMIYRAMDSRKTPGTTAELACQRFRRLQFPKTQPRDEPTELAVHTPTKPIAFIFRSSMTIPCHYASWARPGVLYQLMHALVCKTMGVNSSGAATKLAIMLSLSKPVSLQVIC